MTQYAGNKSLDAEILIDLKGEKIKLDYSLNHLQHPLDSNRSAKLTSQWDNAKTSRKVFYKEFLTQYGLAILAALMLIYIPIYTLLNIKGYVKDPKYQYKHQNFLRWYSTRSQGVYEQAQAGPITSDKVVFHIPCNIWVEYQLEGDYQEKIQTISLVRNFIKFKRFGKYDEIKQDGWSVIFKFSNPPQDGSCLIHHV